MPQRTVQPSKQGFESTAFALEADAVPKQAMCLQCQENDIELELILSKLYFNKVNTKQQQQQRRSSTINPTK